MTRARATGLLVAYVIGSSAFGLLPGSTILPESFSEVFFRTWTTSLPASFIFAIGSGFVGTAAYRLGQRAARVRSILVGFLGSSIVYSTTLIVLDVYWFGALIVVLTQGFLGVIFASVAPLWFARWEAGTRR